MEAMFCYCCILVCMTPTDPNAQLQGWGGAFLRQPAGAAALASGSANTASARYLCSFWNPALLGNLKTKQLSVGSGYRSLGRTDGFICFESAIPPRMGMGVSLVYRGDPFLNNLVDDQEDELPDASYTAFALKTGLSYRLNRKMSAGLAIVVLYQRLPTDFTTAGKLIYDSETLLGGFDFAFRSVITKNSCVGVVWKNLFSVFKWELHTSDAGLNPIINDTLPAPLTIGHELKTTLMKKKVYWNCDISGYVVNGLFHRLDHSACVINNGIEWENWDNVSLRFGVRDIVVTRDMLTHRDSYWALFDCAVSTGVSIDLTALLKNRVSALNYGLSTDKIGVGVEQQLDFQMTF